jgi:hypothetical protein
MVSRLPLSTGDSVPRMSSGLRAVAVLLLPVAITTANGCVQTQRALGEDCLKDQDCLSGICSQLRCAAAPPLLDGAIPSTSGDGGTEATTDAPAEIDVAGDAPAETSMPNDAGGDSGGDAPSE